MYELNSKIRDLVPYEPISGDFKIRLDANESFLQVPEYVMAEAIAKGFSLRINRYPDPLAEELCQSFASAYGLNPAFVVAGNGSDELISVIFNGFLMKGEKYATLAYDFSMYDFYGHLSEGQNVKIPKNEDFTIDPQRVIQTCNQENVRLLIFSNPCNPTSLGLTREQVRQIVQGVNCLVVVDEAYMDFWDQSLLQEVEKYDNLIILKTCSKAYGLAAARVGFAVGAEGLVRAIKAIKSPYNVNSFSQNITSAILHHKGEANAACDQIKMATAELKELLEQLNQKIGGRLEILESCTNFITVKFPEAKEMYQYLLHIGIAVRYFEGFLRITAGCVNENTQLVKFMGNFFGV
jgi:histidinol-phosphate aminotransferase